MVNACPGFSTVLVTTDQPRSVEEFFKKMAIHKPYEVVTLAATDTLSPRGGQVLHEVVSLISANFHLAEYLFKNRKQIDAVYFRDESLFLVAYFARGFLNKKVFFEIHSVYERASRQFKNIFSVWLSNGVVAISTGLKKHYEKINKNILMSLCSAAEDTWFDHSKTKSDFRNELQLRQDTFLLGYAGVIGINPNNDYYEVDEIIRSLKQLPETVQLVVVGEINGNGNWLRKIAEEVGVAGRVHFFPWQERMMIPKFLQASDVIVIPRRKKDLVGDSPAKMFPALASNRPIIAGRAESIEEVLTDGQDSLIVKTNDEQGWADAIKKIYEDSDLSEHIVKGAQVTKTKYTWEKRGLAISAFIGKN